MDLEKLTLPLEVKNGLTTVVAGITATVAAFTAAAGLAINATFKWANELDSIQDIMGVTNKTAAALAATARKSGVGVEKLTKGFVILEKGLVKADGSLDTMGKSLKDWGISAKDANGALKDQEALLGDISNKYNSLGTQQERVNFLTEVFGKSGADLVDFFDTLAADGGIDEVAKKLERLGLVIDPNRYEQFNRSLEELKLIGLSLAVAFTEKVMPIFEKFLEIVTNPELTTPQKISEIVKAADRFIGAFIQGLADSVNDWVSRAGPQELSKKLIDWINNIGQDGAGKPSSETLSAMQNLVTAIANALAQVPWDIIGDTLNQKFNEQWGKVKVNISDLWNGMSFWEKTAGWLGLILALAPGVILVLGKISMFFLSFAPFLAGAGAASLPLGLGKIALAFGAIQAALSGVSLALLLSIGLLFALIGVVIIYDKELTDAFNNTQNKIDEFWANFGKKAREAINDAIGLVNQFLSMFPTLSGTVITIPSIPAPKPKSSGGGSGNKRASGGPVIAGQSYVVNEYKREVFTPNQSGRIDNPTKQTVEFDEYRFATIIGRAVAEQLARG